MVGIDGTAKLADLSPALKLEIGRVMQAEQRRLDDIARAWRYYDGEAPQPLVLTQIKNAQGQAVGTLNDNIRVNFSRLLVDTGVHYLFGAPLGLNYDESGDSEDSANQAIGEWLGEALPMMERMTFLQKMANNGGVAGHTFGRIFLPEPGHKFPRTVVLDPSMIRPTWDPKDIDRVVKWSISFIAIDPTSGKPRQYETVIEPNDPKSPTSWTIIDKEGPPGGVLEADGEPTTWPYPFSPIIHCQNLPRANEFYGSPDLESDLLDLQSSIDRVLSHGNKIVRNWSKPPTFTRGMTGSQAPQIEADPDKVTHLPGTPQEMDVFTLKSEADMAALMDFEKLLVEHLREIAHMPEAASGKASGTLSSLTLKLLFAPIVQMTEAKQNTYGAMVADWTRRLLVVGKKVDSYDAAPTPDLSWGNVVPADEAAEIQRDLADLDLGFSKDTLIERRGGDPDTEREKREKDQVNVGAALLDQFNAGNEPDEQ